MNRITKHGNESPITEDFYNKYDGKQPNWGFNGLGYITYKRTYARTVEGEDRTEEWYETVRRCVEWLYDVHTNMDIKLKEDYYRTLYDTVFNLKANFSGRMLWQAGTDTVDKLGGASLNNCWAVVADSKESFLATFDYLMLGGGVGYNIQKKYVDNLPKIKENVVITHEVSTDADFIVPDSREGWVELLNQILTALFETGKSFRYSTKVIRSYGEPIKGFGGTASGPEPLIKGMSKITEICQKRAGGKLRPVDALDIMNCLGELVVAGNVRRSAQLALGDAYNIDFINAKRWDLGNIPNHRAMSNNTVIANSYDDIPDEIWEGYTGNGEPYGFMNLDTAQNFGRTCDPNRKDPDVIATNPCAEISLAPSKGDGGAESCNLCELYLNNLIDEEEFNTVAKTMYPVVKTIAMLPYHRKKTHEIVSKNLRLGIGLTGIVQRPDLIKEHILNRVYKTIDDADIKWSKEIGVPTSIKLTTVKPSGTLSLLGGATPGIHPAYSQRYIRRIRMASHDPLIDMCKESGYKVEAVKGFDGTEDHRTTVVEFPIELDDDVITAKDMSAIKQLELVKHIQEFWADNQVSVTVYFKPEELDEIKEWMSLNYHKIKTLSFLLHSEHGFSQAPYEEISEESYKTSKMILKPFKYIDVTEMSLEESLECLTGACPVK